MTPGRELDALVAEKVMGLANRRCPHGTSGICAECGQWTAKPYSTDIAAAWEVVEKLGVEYGAFCLIKHPKAKTLSLYPKIHASFGQFVGESESAPHAICLAALKVVGETSN